MFFHATLAPAAAAIRPAGQEGRFVTGAALTFDRGAIA